MSVSVLHGCLGKRYRRSGDKTPESFTLVELVRQRSRREVEPGPKRTDG